jgi:hypothetical protein
MTDIQADRIMCAIERLDEKHDKTREELIEVRTDVKNVVGWVKDQGQRVSKLESNVAAIGAETTAKRETMSHEKALEVLAKLRPKSNPPSKPVHSIRPDHKTGALVGGGGVTLAVLVAAIIARLLGISLPF